MVAEHPNVRNLRLMMEAEQRDWEKVSSRVKRQDFVGFLAEYIDYLEGRQALSPQRWVVLCGLRGLFKQVLAEISPSDEELRATAQLFEKPETD